MPNLTPDDTLLGLLAIHPRHGYELLDCFGKTQQLGRVWKLSTSQLYNVLKRLEREGLVLGQELPPESGPPRVHYRLTERGRERLMRWLHEPQPSPSIRRVRVEFLSRLFIARELRLPTAHIIQHQQAACQHEQERLWALAMRATPGMDALTLTLMLEQLAAALRWLEYCAANLPAEAQTHLSPDKPNPDKPNEER